jgi:hypothetical protein
MDNLNLATTIDQHFTAANADPSPTSSDDNPNMLQRTRAAANDATPDPRYWTAYDRFMIERQARALRRQYVYGLVAKARRRLREIIAGAPLKEGGPHR